MMSSHRFQRISCTTLTAIIIGLFYSSCSKNSDDSNNEPGVPAFELNFTGAINKKSVGSYSVVQFTQDKTTLGKPIYTASIGLSSKQGELFSIVLTKEGGVTPGTYPIDFTFDPFLSTTCVYTENGGAKLYGAVSGTFRFLNVSATHVKGTIDLSMEDNGSLVQVKGNFNAVKP